MRRSLALYLMLSLTTGLLTGPPAAAAADGDPVGAQQQLAAHVVAANWFWREQQRSPVDGSVLLPDATGDPSALAVAGPTVEGRPEKLAVIKLDLSALRAAGAVRRAILTLPVMGDFDVSGGTGVDSPDAAPAPVLVCVARGSWRDGAGARPLAEAPRADCSVRVAASAVSGNQLQADISSLIGVLATADVTGLVLLPNPDRGDPYELRIGPRQDIAASVTLSAVDDIGASAGPPDEPGPAALPSRPDLAVGLPTASPVPKLPGGEPPRALPRPETARTVLPDPPEPPTLAVFVLLALVGLGGLVFLSPSLT